MLTLFDNQINGALVRFLSYADMVCVRAQHVAKYMARFLLLFGCCLCEAVFGDTASAGPVTRLWK